MKIIVEKNGQVIWERIESPPSGMMRRDDAELLEIIAALEESIVQAKANVSTFHADVVSDIGLVSFADIKGDVPVARMGSGDPNGETLVESAVMSEGTSCLVALEVGVVGQHDVALGVGVDDHNVAAIEMLSGVDELHGGGGSSNSSTNA